jgi:hypothetical protein
MVSFWVMVRGLIAALVVTSVGDGMMRWPIVMGLVWVQGCLVMRMLSIDGSVISWCLRNDLHRLRVDVHLGVN